MTAVDCKPRVLVVDDEPQILSSIRALLEDDFDVVVSSDADDAFHFLKDAQIAVILADQRMPHLTGDQFLAQAREICDATRILVTGYVDIDALIRAVNNGQIHSYVAKPWEPGALKMTVSRAAIYAREVSQRKHAAELVVAQQEALSRSEAAHRQQTKILRSVLDSMGDGVLVVDENGSIILRNRAAEQVGAPGPGFMAPISDWAGYYGLYVPGTEKPYPPDQVPLMRAMRGETADGIELLVRNGTDPDAYISVNVRPFRDDSGNVKGGVAVFRDITAAKSSEKLLLRAKLEAERANRAKSEFLSRMSHELRTPLNSILGFAQLLSLAELTSHQDNIQQILKGGYHLLGLINEVLDLARIEAGRLEMTLEPVRVKDALVETLDLVRPLANQQNISLVMESQAPPAVLVEADRQRLKQVLLNLLSNAIKFNHNGGRVTVRCTGTEDRRLRVEVADNGSGIDEDGLRRIFTPFERLDADRNAVGGTGLGLALCKGMIEAMGGTIGVESVPGKGSTFHFELAVAADAGSGLAEDVTPAAPALSTGRSSRQGTLLYIEDNLANLRLIEEIVSRYPAIRLVEAMQGKLGLELAGTAKPDWILLDSRLPDLSGEEVLHALRSSPKTAGIPVTILSADATPATMKRLVAAGAREYLTKPLDVRQLIDLLEATLPPGPQDAIDEASPLNASARVTQDGRADDWNPATVTLRELPVETVDQIRAAVLDGQKDRLNELIAGVETRDRACARGLKELADRYDYDALIGLIAEARR